MRLLIFLFLVLSTALLGQDAISVQQETNIPLEVVDLAAPDLGEKDISTKDGLWSQCYAAIADASTHVQHIANQAPKETLAIAGGTGLAVLAVAVSMRFGAKEKQRKNKALAQQDLLGKAGQAVIVITSKMLPLAKDSNGNLTLETGSDLPPLVIEAPSGKYEFRIQKEAQGRSVEYVYFSVSYGIPERLISYRVNKTGELSQLKEGVWSSLQTEKTDKDMYKTYNTFVRHLELARDAYVPFFEESFAPAIEQPDFDIGAR